jgi:thiamine-phosphate pyrophosphorylase
VVGLPIPATDPDSGQNLSWNIESINPPTAALDTFIILDGQLFVNADLDLIRSAGLRLGLSTHGYAEMVHADRLCPSYIAMGAVFPTMLKQMPTAPQGLGRLYQYAKLLSHYPLVAIGGIDETNIHAVAQSGVGSVGIVRAITSSDNPATKVKELQELMRT